MRIAAARWGACRRIFGPAGDSLHVNRRALALVALAAVAALLAYVPVASLRGSAVGGAALRLADTPVPATDIRWTTAVRGGGVTQQVAVADLMTLLFMASVGAVAVAVLAMASVSASRAWRRAGELVLRRAVGASRRDLLLSAVVEALVVTLVVAAAGALLALSATRLAVAAWPGPAEGWRLAPFAALGVVAVTILLSAIAPVGAAASRRLVDTGERTIPAFVPATQLGLSLGLLAASVAVLRQPVRATGEGPLPGNGAVYHLDAGALPLEERASTFARLVSKLQSTDGVVAVSLTSAREHVGLGTVDFLKTDCGICPVGGLLLPWRELYAAHFFVSGDTFRTQGARIVAGRGFTAGDGPAAAPVAVVNRYLAARYFQNGEAIGRDIYVGSGIRAQAHVVVGVVDDPRPAAFGGAGQPLEAVYLSVLQHPVEVADLLVRTEPGSGATGARVSALVGAWPGIRRVAASRERELVARERAPVRWFGGAFALEALAIFTIALVGTFTAMALWVRALHHELALRRAVGASRRRIAAHVLLRAAGVGARGAAVGAVFFAPVVLPELERLMPGVRVWDPGTFAALAALLAVAALGGAVLPLRAALARPPAAGLASE